MDITWICEQLENVLGQLGVSIRYENLGDLDVPAKGGFCRINGEPFCIVDRGVTTQERIALLKACIGKMNLENIYIKPAIRNLLDVKRGGYTKKNASMGPDDEA